MAQRPKKNYGNNVRRWFFTLNNPNRTGAVTIDADGTQREPQSEEDIARILGSGKGFRYLVFQLEQGELGTPHYQGDISQLAIMCQVV